ncbi:ankyrin repeat domain-containing protein 26-like isoform X1 [Pongo pygmaeus]|uniref:ankyrin repeat domain-containing protein 26-like isoform X1 n=1 Tax=Pongo pygmaeus TaxID=9600 RepID=UPI0023E2F323|nr:ankyrin repeat domain-containing protein 26-like [Pongo pygmaeus]XP_054301955.1 ankyrin repeat domain-containing protein 26 [Pongo pygmaeus]
MMNSLNSTKTTFENVPQKYDSRLTGADGQRGKITIKEQEDSLEQYHHLKPKIEMKEYVSNQAVGMKDVQACTSAFSDLDFNSLTFSNEIHERSENLKVGGLRPFVSPPMTNTVLGSTDLGQMNLIDQEKMTTAGAFLFWNHTLRDLC